MKECQDISIRYTASDTQRIIQATEVPRLRDLVNDPGHFAGAQELMADGALHCPVHERLALCTLLQSGFDSTPLPPPPPPRFSVGLNLD